MVHREKGEAQVTPVWLDGLTEERVNSWLVETDGEGNVTGGYLVGQLADTRWLEAHLPRLLDELRATIMAPLAQAEPLADKALRMTLIPTGRLSLLPLHAAAPDNWIVTYAPSATSLLRAQQEMEQRRGAPFLVGVGNPLPSEDELRRLRNGLKEALAGLQLPETPEVQGALKNVETLLARPLDKLRHQGRELVKAVVILLARLETQGEAEATFLALALQWPQSLPHAKGELEDICARLPRRCAAFYEEKATQDELLSALPQATLLHFACHGHFNPQKPLESGLVLADGRLTLQDLQSLERTSLAQVRLGVLSACQTAITDFAELPDEAVGLPAAFLGLGIPGVVGALWPVSDHSTRLLMERFYGHVLGDGLDLATALHRAATWLRTVTYRELGQLYKEMASRMPPDEAFHQLATLQVPAEKLDEPAYGNPYHWAGFGYYGL